MKLFLLFTILIFALTNAHEYTVYDMNGKIQGSFNGELNKYIISDFAKKNHSSILVQKGTINKSSTLQNIIQYNPSSVLKNYTERDIDISLDSLGKELWIEVEKNEIIKLEHEITTKRYTLVPLKLYFKKNKVKVELGVCQGKKLYDKRESIKERDIKRDTDKALKGKF